MARRVTTTDIIVKCHLGVTGRDGVMIGRAAYQHPFIFATADTYFHQSTLLRNELPPLTRKDVLVNYLEVGNIYVEMYIL
jgi:tRNA-dihydrouridine synthase